MYVANKDKKQKKEQCDDKENITRDIFEFAFRNFKFFKDQIKDEWAQDVKTKAIVRLNSKEFRSILSKKWFESERKITSKATIDSVINLLSAYADETIELYNRIEYR